jgi:hypothetical protein
MSPTEIKYALIDRYGGVFYCDPDYYPVAREGQEEQRAAEQFPVIRAQAEEFQAIVKRLGMDSVIDFSGEQKMLVYREHKKLSAVALEPSGAVYAFKLRVEDRKSQGSAIEGTITRQGTVTVTKQEPTFTTCPICLAGDTLIQTPSGEVPVRDLQSGTLVWTVDASGRKVTAPVLTVGMTPVPPTHVMVRLALSDGRALTVSPGHPLPDGQAIGTLQIGDTVDGAVVVSVATFPASVSATYDLLPDSATGWYWANGVLVASTMGR